MNLEKETPGERGPYPKSLPRLGNLLMKMCTEKKIRDKPHKGSRRASRQTSRRSHSARCDTEGNSNADLQKQVDEMKALLKDITPGRGPVKHSTLLPFSERLRHAKMPRGFRMPKFKTFSGFGDPSNHLKSFDSQLSFWASDDETTNKVVEYSLQQGMRLLLQELMPRIESFEIEVPGISPVDGFRRFLFPPWAIMVRGLQFRRNPSGIWTSSLSTLIIQHRKSRGTKYGLSGSYDSEYSN
ncbi:hypothetical protein LIER_22135 [Lithospermum erythrorhizon]|uniref:Uncharacterized protein n=1 Tax=Lithospermum erythrorhizon TaxID=34254 RepID=A0AAV3QW76_LITER